MTPEAVLEHLWQSTLVAGAIALLSLALRRTQAQTRYWMWFAASLKFLIPFGALTSLGTLVSWRQALPVAPPEWTVAVETVSRPFLLPPVHVVLPPAPGLDIPVVGIAVTIWILGCMAILAIWLLRWRRIAAAVRASSLVTTGRVHDLFGRLRCPTTLPLVSSETSCEPGVFGIVRPVLLWPRDIDSRLNDEQIRAILVHELTHAKRRDNVTAAVHMLVEAVFWFHPLVWWIGTRLVDERERACDEEVVRLGSDPQVYAESILKTCQYFVESPLSCVTGVTGSDLKERIERIMSERPTTRLSVSNRTLLVTAAAVTLGAPVVTGALIPARRPHASIKPTQQVERETAATFEAATVKPNNTGAMRVTMRILPGGAYEAANVTLESMIRIAYRLQESQLVGGPAWMYNDRFDIVAKAEEGAAPGLFAQHIQALLADRFNLRVHTETRELPIYALVVANGDGSRGPRLTPSTVDCTPLARGRAGTAPPLPTKPGERPQCGTIAAPGRIMGGSTSLSQMAMTLSQYTGRMVFDRTGLEGNFDYDIEFGPDPSMRGRGPGGGLPGSPSDGAPRPAVSDRPSLFTAVQVQLGLRLDSQRGAVDVLVVDSADQPSEN